MVWVLWVLLDGTLLSFVYEPYQARSWKAIWKDAIHFDLIESHEWNKKKKSAFYRTDPNTLFCVCVPHLLYLSKHGTHINF